MMTFLKKKDLVIYSQGGHTCIPQPKLFGTPAPDPTIEAKPSSSGSTCASPGMDAVCREVRNGLDVKGSFNRPKAERSDMPFLFLPQTLHIHGLHR